MTLAASDLDSMKTAISFSQSLSQWSVLIIGGSVAALVGTSNWRPAKTWIRCIYLLFLPALTLLFVSAYYGVAAQRNCLAIMLMANADTIGAKVELNENLRSQLATMQWGFFFLGVWFVIFVFWWIFDSRISADRKG
jgi:hypothetical protein